MTYTLDEIQMEKERLEKEISKLLKESWLNDPNRFHLSRVDIFSIDAVIPGKFPAYIEAKLQVVV